MSDWTNDAKVARPDRPKTSRGRDALETGKQTLSNEMDMEAMK